jgi:hypothetical protein
MEPSQLQEFEDGRWSERDQELVWRHEAALELITEEPVLDVAGGDGLILSLLRDRKGFSRYTMDCLGHYLCVVASKTHMSRVSDK